MFTVSLQFSLLTVALAINYETECPIRLYHNLSPKFEGSFKGGTKADITDHPYQAAILHFNRHYCSATILSKYTVLTAAHCIYPWLRMRLDQYYVRVGSNSLQAPGQEVGIGHFVTHEKYQHGETFDYDVALVFVSEPFTHPLAIPVKIPERTKVYNEGDSAVIVGYRSDQLYSVQVAVISNQECQGKLQRFGQLVTSDFWCGNSLKSTRGSCSGMTGGAAIIGGELAGIVMFGPDCIERGYPGLYLNVPKFLDWMDLNGAFEDVL